MKPTWLSLLVLSLSSLAHACAYNTNPLYVRLRVEKADIQDPSYLTDLSQPTPFVFVETWTIQDCANGPQQVRVQLTAYAGTTGSTAFTELSDMVFTASDQNSVILSHTFPKLTVNMLTPGELIEMVKQ
jgi:hypothetical protein